MPVITADNVLEVTGVAVSSSDIAQAVAIVEVVAGVNLDTLTRYRGRNQAWLRRAICYQAAWIPSQPDLFSRLDVTGLSQDGQSYQLRDELSLIVAPMARRALSQLSWRKSRTLHARADTVRRAQRDALNQSGGYPFVNGAEQAFLTDQEADSSWMPLGAASSGPTDDRNV